MKKRGTYHIALTVVGTRSKRLARLTRILAGTFEEYGHPVESSKLIDEEKAVISASHYRTSISIIRDLPPADARPATEPTKRTGRLKRNARKLAEDWRVEIEMAPADPMNDDRDISELLLAVVLYRLTTICEAQSIEWLSPDTTMSANEFLDAFHSISPGEAKPEKVETLRRNSRFDTIDNTIDKIADRAPPISDRRPGVPWITRDLDLDQDLQEFLPPAVEPETYEQPNDIQRLTVWAMTGTVAFLSAPVALSMTMVNLLRGEDFRLSTHVLALTAFLAMLQTTGTLDRAVANLPL